MTRRPTIAVALDGAGWHPAAWRDPSARPAELFTARYWRDLAQFAERADVDLVTIEDALGLQSSTLWTPDERTDQVRGRLDALLIASFVAPVTSRIGLVPTVTTTHTEPFHVATGLQTLDIASRGRAGWRAQLSGSPTEAAHFGRRTLPPVDIAALQAGDSEQIRPGFDEARDVVEVVRRLWDSWEADAIIRDAASGRFIDREKIHGAEFSGEWFDVHGASIVPRSPQGQPLVAVLAHQTIPYELAATSADLVFITPLDDAQSVSILAEVRDAETRTGRTGRPLSVLAEVIVVLESTPAAARAALERLDEQNGSPLTSDALIFAGTPEQLLERIDAWTALGYDGVRIRPARLPRDLEQLADWVLPALPRADAAGTTLRERLGFELPENRYTAARRATGAARTNEEAA
ncbi:Flavin-dependent oxidoreductase, luciferase family (includes alkanesulfonate monooxygenase SsuD and methylene tetrahydromethanopterin reductase) [Agromyces sp. CF514]|uniref:LLM class flavin-dependent oxidoreductase n=1 Tax=Agromyces sp. CF514 TaxID=1881031 RepID=UPI0008E7F09D|nr:LLM class flavin-dependent oxidoreductase [Agromyces sp. CF514]SFR69470.1 Flavin-dependent oxidoreductase, luciferase family (includes alkanesulfonate monooxygenase SsuD and methylene tetrahydromethanopterin reductase) [Agromyces sp. CF514]